VVAAGVTADPDRVAQHVVGEIGDLLRHGGPRRTASGAWPAAWPTILRMSWMKPYVEHAVGLVEHEHLDPLEADGRLCMRSIRRPGVATRRRRRR
jgi:hypothetical protein